MCAPLCCDPTVPSKLSFCVLQVSNFHDVELLMRIIALYDANATDALGETIDQQSAFYLFRARVPSRKATVP